MIEDTYIIDSALPANQDFNLLKAQALAFIQERSGSNWTNFNASDSGITILDQLCFALTELGYCTGFPMADILTDSDGNLVVEDQFYLPAQIFTTTPVTIADYRKVIIDCSPSIANAYVEMYESGLPGIANICRVYVRLANQVSPNLVVDDLMQEVYFQLNSKRNLALIMDMPRVLTPKQYPIHGTIELGSANQFSTVVNQLINLSAEAVFKSCTPISYAQAQAKGYQAQDIYNGPLLKNGFLLTEDLGDKQDSFSVQKLAQLIQSIEGIVVVADLCFNADGDTDKPATCSTDELIVFDWVAAIQQQTISFMANGSLLGMADLKLPNNAELGTLKVPSKNEALELPKGSFRDINTYYSVQYTFPEAFQVGNAATEGGGGSSLKSATTNQMVGYLALYDQVLANQFAQLANLSTLFSFKNGESPAPSDLNHLLSQKNKIQPQKQPWPVPFQSFAPAYFCQSLYPVPNIRYLLKDNYTFEYNTELIGLKELEEQSWKKYKNDPYNAYMNGLIELTVGSGSNNLIQRNKMLDHLLARHGESPLLIDEVINGSQYTGDPLNDKVIFKSLYLQNFGLLSYYQPKAINFYAAKAISLEMPTLSEAEFERGLEGLNNDFIFDTDKTNDTQKLKSADFTSFAAIQLKINILFGLNPLYNGFIIGSTDDESGIENSTVTNPIESSAEEIDLTPEAQQALWLMQQQKGMLVIETGLLFANLQAVVSFKTSQDTASYWKIDQPVNLFELSLIRNYISVNGLNLTESNFTISIYNNSYGITEINAEWITASDTYSLTDGLYSFNLDYAQNGFPVSEMVQLQEQDLIFLFPSYIGTMGSFNFQQKMYSFLTNNLPANTNFGAFYLKEDALSEIIPAFAAWRNSMLYTQNGFPSAVECSALANTLMQTVFKYTNG